MPLIGSLKSGTGRLAREITRKLRVPPQTDPPPLPPFTRSPSRRIISAGIVFVSGSRQTQTRFFLLVLALVAGCVLGALGLPAFHGASAQSSTGKFNGLIAFGTNRNGPSGKIYVMNPDGSNQHGITNSPGGETRPAFSPDGKKIAFVRDFKAILMMNPDGSGQTTVVDGASAGFSYITAFPDWSPDGKKIVFNAIAKDSRNGADIYVINVDGTGLTQLTTDPTDDSSPAWSPDGTKIAF